MRQWITRWLVYYLVIGLVMGLAALWANGSAPLSVAVVLVTVALTFGVGVWQNHEEQRVPRDDGPYTVKSVKRLMRP